MIIVNLKTRYDVILLSLTEEMSKFIQLIEIFKVLVNKTVGI